MRIRWVVVCGPLAATVVHRPHLAAQENGQAAAAQHRNDCRLAAQVLATGEPHTRREWALQYSGKHGPAALAAVWRAIPAGDRNLARLTAASMLVRDRHIYEAALEVAASNGRPEDVRTAAMAVLLKYVVPESSIRLGDLVAPDSIRYIHMAGGSTTYHVQTEGAAPVGGGLGSGVLTLLERLAADRTGQPRNVWYAAASVARRIRWELNH